MARPDFFYRAILLVKKAMGALAHNDPAGQLVRTIIKLPFGIVLVHVFTIAKGWHHHPANTSGLPCVN